MSRRYYAYRRRKYRYRRDRIPPQAVAVVAGAILLAAAGTAAHHGHSGNPGIADDAGTSSAAAAAISYARQQIGCPYTWGGTGGCEAGYDCSGLVMEAYESAGIDIPRTSQEEWAQLPHVPASRARPGDLVFFAGSDGTWLEPGHVALVIGHDRILQAYATGTSVMVSSYGTPGSLEGIRNGDVVGYAAPAAVIAEDAAVSYAGSWPAAFLRSARLPATRCDRAVIAAWARAEDSNPAWRNPLDSTMTEPGSRPVNSDGVQAYVSRRQGLIATAATLRNGLYGPVISALQAGDDPQGAADAVADSRWGTQRFEASC